jgi:hypothetical protein
MTEHPELFAALAAPFDPNELKQRAQAGRQIPYVTARTVMNRLDAVLGPENWWDDFVPLEHSVICRLTIRLPDGTILTKCDAGGYAGLADPGDDDKSGFADAFKRTAVKFGVGRYLYRDGVPSFARAGLVTANRPKAAPDTQPHGSDLAEAKTRSGADAGILPGDYPRSGRALFAWIKDQDKRLELGLLRHMNTWGRAKEFPPRMVDWEPSQVSLAVAEVRRQIQSLQKSSDASRIAALT